MNLLGFSAKAPNHFFSHFVAHSEQAASWVLTIATLGKCKRRGKPVCRPPARGQVCDLGLCSTCWQSTVDRRSHTWGLASNYIPGAYTECSRGSLFAHFYGLSFTPMDQLISVPVPRGAGHSGSLLTACNIFKWCFHAMLSSPKPSSRKKYDFS